MEGTQKGYRENDDVCADADAADAADARNDD